MSCTMWQKGYVMAFEKQLDRKSCFQRGAYWRVVVPRTSTEGLNATTTRSSGCFLNTNYQNVSIGKPWLGPILAPIRRMDRKLRHQIDLFRSRHREAAEQYRFPIRVDEPRVVQHPWVMLPENSFVRHPKMRQAVSGALCVCVTSAV